MAYDLQRRQQNGVSSTAAITPAASASSASGTGAQQTASASTSSIPLAAAPGMITITQPPMQSTSYYKIAQGEYITIAWNFTGLYVTPASLTLSAVCENGNTYPVGPTNGIIPGDSTSVVWYPYGYQQANPSVPLVPESYTLHIWGDGGPSAVAQAGYLEPNSNLIFAMYTPEAYTPLASGWQCAGCSGAMSQFTAHPAFTGILATLLIMLFSGFTTLRRARN
ncbi:hypothetical protein BJ138DRAFT_1014304 [Hygrophoropsis aurantiaca]|uniref:Uncharacterized protein n=1 Tax=Hygrophoropsis aurantiaca TaxID=72124 RepID=A0ACB8A2P2_9AGAM|nr:hypothetical protein BJ138DRAFT_1014304 [Hygrophoropsis aurantiaca]